MNDNGEKDSPKVPKCVANERKLQATDLFAADSGDENGKPECCEETVREVCAQVFHKYEVPPFYSAEDLAHDVIVRFMPYVPLYRGDAEIRTVLHRIAKNQIIDVVRKERRRTTLPELQRDRDEDKKSDEDHFDEMLRRNQGETKRNHIEEQEVHLILVKELQPLLTARQRRIWRLMADGHSLADIAKILGVKPQAISKSKSKIERRCRAYLESPLQIEFRKCARL